MYIEGKYINGMDDLSELYAVRKEVFGTESIDVSSYFGMNTDLFSDQMAIHAIARIQGNIVGVGTMFFDGETFLLDRVGVLEGERRKKYGDFIVRMLVDRAFLNHGTRVSAFAPMELSSFFESIGFVEEGRKGELIHFVLNAGSMCRECQSLH